ncbi:LPS-assembly protein LptD [Pollutimonas thiosulfatoxidans]|uniref:LPS-assembly protein LptD n=1 Tax=Pollutimonas thiosulfatoxidans TaxID=2028345 RepID=A0A410GCR5_9BURK|nr:LPS assembly protein LptD [Pollutimonas thiosulfatoxidans]QAA94059.1 LPS biosynthesis protein [Pollutimonas thiosulfatoxidans]
MRSVWWAVLFAVGGASAVQAQQPDAPARARAPVAELRVAPNLQIHRNVNEDDMSAFLVADKMETDENDKIILTGSAQVRRIDSIVKGDHIDYERSTGQVHVRGNGLILRDASVIKGPKLTYNVDSETGQISDPNFWLGATGGAGTATQADIYSRDHMRLSDVTYSGCPCPDPSWYIESPQVDLHFDDNEGIARHGVLYFKDVPILYSPWLSFPIKKERKSGFLLPTYGTSSSGGFELTLPYYFNIAPNYDATITPRYMAKRGMQLGAEFRYLGEGYSGQVYGTYLTNDQVADRKRWYYAFQHAHSLGGGVNASFDIRRVSDDDYFRDFSSFGLNEASYTYLPSSAGLTWSGAKYFSTSLYAYSYQTLQDRTSSYLLPQYDKLPELYVRGARYNWGGFDVQSDNYATRFVMPKFKYNTHDYPGPVGLEPYQSYDGTRFSSYTSVAYPIVRAGWYVTPKVGVHMSQYNMDWHGFSQPFVAATGPQSKTQSRVLPIMSLDTGMTFERDASLFGNDSIQTLEPRLYYLRVPYRDQSELPIFDTYYADFNFAQAFDENVFSGGWDRIADADQLTVGLTTRWLDAGSGFERLSLSAAQRIYFRDQLVTLYPGDKGRTDTKSDYLVGAAAALTDTLSVRFGAQFNPESRDRNRMTAGFRWVPKRLATISASYRYKRDPVQITDPFVVYGPGYIDNSQEQVSVASQWPLTNKIYALGRYDYSLQEKRGTQSILGLEYRGDCCWTARVVMQRYAVSREKANTAMFFQLELSGLGSLGTDPMRLLRERISGYETITPPVPEKTTFERYE